MKKRLSELQEIKESSSALPQQEEEVCTPKVEEEGVPGRPVTGDRPLRQGSGKLKHRVIQKTPWRWKGRTAAVEPGGGPTQCGALGTMESHCEL